MKKLFLLPVLSLLIFTSCTDDNEEAAPQTLSEQIEGSWVTIDQEYNYYDENGQLVHEEREDTPTTFTFEGSNITIEYGDGDTEQGSYTISEIGGADFIDLSSNLRIGQYEITSFNESAMTWEARLEYYPYDAGTTTEIADHAIITLDFRRQ